MSLKMYLKDETCEMCDSDSVEFIDDELRHCLECDYYYMNYDYLEEEFARKIDNIHKRNPDEE